MLEIHTTSAGRSMLIAQMDDDHLCNMIHLVIRKAHEVKRLAEGEDHLSEYEQELYNVRPTTPEEAARATRWALQKLYPYLSEAYLRGLDGPRQELAEFLGRDSKIMINVPLLEAPAGSRRFRASDHEWESRDVDDEQWHPGHPSNFGDS